MGRRGQWHIGEKRPLVKAKETKAYCHCRVGLRHRIFANFSLACCQCRRKIFGQFVKFDAAFSLLASVRELKYTGGQGLVFGRSNFGEDVFDG